MKKYTSIGIIVAVLITICAGIYIYNRSLEPETVIFSGINGEEISVRTIIKSQEENTETESKDRKPGDIIEINGSKEIVIAVSEDGRYITLPLEEYLNESQ